MSIALFQLLPCISPPKTRVAGRPSISGPFEVLVATTLLGLLAGSAIWALLQANNYASISRLYTGAETVAQNRIDRILSDGPFNPQNNQVPEVIKIPLDAGGTATDAAPVEIYNEPSPAENIPHLVYGQITTTVSKVAARGKAGVDLNLYAATVVVTYTFRGKPYRVQLNALRPYDSHPGKGRRLYPGRDHDLGRDLGHRWVDGLSRPHLGPGSFCQEHRRQLGPPTSPGWH